MNETDERKQYYEAKREPKRRLSSFKRHKQEPPVRYNPREGLAIMETYETRRILID